MGVQAYFQGCFLIFAVVALLAFTNSVKCQTLINLYSKNMLKARGLLD